MLWEFRRLFFCQKGDILYNNYMSKRKPAKKASKIKSLSQAHGKEEKKFVPTTLEQIWGEDGVSKYGTLDETEYTAKLDDMHFSDMRTHAANVGLIPIDDQQLLRKRLLSEFRKHRSEFTTPDQPIDQNLDLDEKARQILEEGK